MGRNQGRSGRKGGKRAESEASPLRRWRAAGVAALGLALVCAGGWGVAAVHARAGGLLTAARVHVEIEWPRGPGGDTWLAASIREHITGSIESRLAGRPVDARSLADVGTLLAAGGWFDGAPTVRRTGDDRVSVSGVWRTPAGALRSGGRDYVLDWKARPLPIDFAPGASGLKVISGASSDVPRSAGGALIVEAPWPGEDVLAGLELLRPLLAEPFAGQIAGIDVGEYFTAGRLVIVTDRGSQIVWGGRFGEFVPGEAPSGQKLAILRSNANNPQFGRRIDLGKRRIEIMDERGLMVDLTEPP